MELLLKIELETIERVISLIESLGLTNEQYFLNFLDELNKLSVKY